MGQASEESGPVGTVLPRRQHRETILTYDEENRLLNAADPFLKPILTFALNTGLRRGQIFGLQWEHVDLARGKIHLPARLNKGKRPYTLPLNDTARAVLMERERSGDRIFDNSYDEVRFALKRALRDAGLDPGVRFHDLRHTFATRLAASGCDISTLRVLMQHASLRTTQRYIHVQEDSMVRAVKALDSSHSGGQRVEFPQKLSYAVNVGYPMPYQCTADALEEEFGKLAP